MMRVRATLRHRHDDGGFTLIELITAIGVFGTLMAIVGAATLSGFKAINEAKKRSSIQVDSQTAMEWASRLLRYAKAPDASTNVMPEATAAAVTVYTYSGTGPKQDVPYKVRIHTQAVQNGTAVVADVWTPKKTSGVWSWPDLDATAPVDPLAKKSTRVLLTLPAATVGSPVQFKYYACTPTGSGGCWGTRRQVTPNASGALPLNTLEVPESIVITMGDPKLTASMVTQTVKLVNQA